MRRSREKKTRERRTSQDAVLGLMIRSLGARGKRARTRPGCDLRRAAPPVAQARRSGCAGARACPQDGQCTDYVEGERETAVPRVDLGEDPLVRGIVVPHELAVLDSEALAPECDVPDRGLLGSCASR